MNASATYNVIFSQPLLNIFQTIVSTCHVDVKFLSGEEIITIYGDLIESRTCYLKIVSIIQEEILQLEVNKESNLEAVEDVVVKETEIKGTFWISSSFNAKLRGELFSSLREYKDVFA